MEFETKDSGKRTTFESGMQRDTQEGKILWHLVYDGPMLQRWAELLTRGAVKYSEGNWMNAEGAEEYHRFKASAARHFAQWMRGDMDEDHAAAVIFNLNGAEFVARRMALQSSMEVFVNSVPTVVDEPTKEVYPPEAAHGACCGGSYLPYEPESTHIRLDLFKELEAAIFTPRADTVGRDKCGTVDGVHPIPKVERYNIAYDIKVLSHLPPDHVGLENKHWRINPDDTVSFVDPFFGVDWISNVDIRMLRDNEQYAPCDAQGRGL